MALWFMPEGTIINGAVYIDVVMGLFWTLVTARHNDDLNQR